MPLTPLFQRRNPSFHFAPHRVDLPRAAIAHHWHTVLPLCGYTFARRAQSSPSARRFVHPT
jgi:hypothetical protein